MPSTHRRYADWTVERVAARPLRSASHCRAVRADPEARPHPEQGFRACLGIVWLVRPFGADRLEAAATRAIEVGTRT
jgi:hypothetical protein